MQRNASLAVASAQGKMIAETTRKEALMKIEHVAIWCRDLDALCEFYVQRFGAHPGPLYHKPRTGFRSYFLGFGDGARLELMATPSVVRNNTERITSPARKG